MGSRVKGPINGDELIDVRITLKAPSALQKKADELANQPISQRTYSTREEFEKLYAVDDATIGKVEQFARDHNLAVSRIDKAQHAVYLTGNARDVSLAFQTYLEYYEQPDGVTYRGRTGSLHVPEDLADAILSINGLDERPVAKPKVRVYAAADASAGPSVNYTPQELARLYSFPAPSNPGQGQCIAIIELGGGFRQGDLNTYFGPGGPAVTAVSVDRGRNNPTGSPNGPDGEVMLDIEVAGAIAPKAAIAVYFAPNTNKGFLDAISAAVHDNVRKPSVISISWGSAEDGGGYSSAVLNSFDQIFQAAAVLGITVLAAAGDGGSSDGLTGDHVDFPASSPRVTGCGGTRLLAPDKQNIQSETVWNDGAQGGATGGGVSKVFPVPDYQKGLVAVRTNSGTTALTGRGVPDIAGNADPVTGYQVLVDGQRFAVGGTSAVAPLLAGLIALLNQQLGKPVGFWNPMLYSEINTQAVRDISTGNNGTYAAAQGWDACTGVGVPVGTRMLSALQGQAAQTA
jgi:kumamolisin